MVLDSFLRLNSVVSLHTPWGAPSSRSSGLSLPVSDSAAEDTAPETILLLSWAGAASRHIEKYTNLYIEKHSAASIILVRSGLENFLARSNKKQRCLVEPAVNALLARSGRRLLVHAFSNGGAKTWCTINAVYRRTTGRLLSCDLTIIDSAPGRSSFKQSQAAIRGGLPKQSIPRAFLEGAFNVVLCMMWIANHVPDYPEVVKMIRKELNDESLISRDGRRCYIYSDSDDIIGSTDVEDHAEEAAERGWRPTLVKFKGSQHVAHFKQDPTLYWDIVEGSWKSAIQDRTRLGDTEWPWNFTKKDRQRSMDLMEAALLAWDKWEREDLYL